MLKIEELRKLSTQELAEELLKNRKDLFKLSLAMNMGTDKASHNLQRTRKYIARVKTIQKEQEINDAKQVKGQEEVDKKK